MPVRNALEALTMRPTQFLCSAWPWRSLTYLVGGVGFGLVTFALLTVLIGVGVILSIVVVGVAAYVGTVLAAVGIARMERWRMRLVDDDTLPDPHGPPPRRGIRGWVMFRLRETATWRELGYTLLSALMLCWMDAAVLAGAILIPFWVILTPFYANDQSLWVTVPVAFGGVPLAIIMAYPVTAWAGARAAMARAILAPRADDADVKLVEVTRSRARLLDAFELERRRIERDLHDGAQQRLVALSMKLGLARLEIPSGSAAAEQVATAHELAKQALTEIRELIRGVHPKVLTDRGLEAAVGEVVATVPIPVDVTIELPGRLSPIIEVTAYFVVVETLTNVAKHSEAQRVSVTGELAGGQFVLQVRDDGHGGADPTRGTGLIGLADRVAAVDGTVALSSPPGGPTLVRIEIPVPA
ncbi:sensor histidine kinase [Actinoplanes sp. TBRC 11911]|uniref:sensor histidine kinase n=1 Tax=Actinoplanes sp. TBRC 11911 TaxID=2729386 RepID=UPI00145F036C|nr:sensor histidine kinase [Actinoplanes sp. TBRC 11911]NMO53535.1 sensor histidine kinase [Actinoplanes sp. TBRC 11911]